MDLGQEHGKLQDLSSPILRKVQQGFMYMRTCLSDNAHQVFTGFGDLEGPNDSTMFVGWDKAASRLVLSCRIMDFTFLTGMRQAKLMSPPWLSHLAGDAQVEVNCLRVLQAFVAPEDGGTDLKSLIKSTIGDVSPRRIVCVGFCAAGSVTTLAAAWAAVQWPTADVRCISFGAPAVGNAEFTASFKWLVGISYRVMFRRDPVPTALASTGLKHVHGAVYICGDAMRLGIQVRGQIAPLADLGDHAFTGYSGALYATCKIQSDREKATGGACRAKIDTQASFKPSSSLRSNSLRSEGSLSLASEGSVTETVDSLEDGEDEPAISKQPTVADRVGVRDRVKAAHPRLARAFSMLERDSGQVDQSDLSNLQRVLVMGKISQAAIVAGAAYRNQETFKQQTGITNSRLIKDKVHHDTKVHVGWLEGGTAVFAFRGTASKQDGLQDVKILSRNIDYLQELYPGVKAHLGFMQQFAAVCNPEKPETNIAAVLKELSGGQTPNRVICCGHSLGGALATLGAAWAALEYPDADIRCITFGSTRVANKVFGKAFNALVGTSLRLVHGFDPVPSLPPSLMYKHVPGVIHIKRDSLLLKHRPWHTMLRSSVTDHSMRKYSMGIYKHMPGGLEAHLSFFATRPVARLCDKVAQAAHHAVASGHEAKAADEGKQIEQLGVSSPPRSRRGLHSRSHSSSFEWMSGELEPQASAQPASSSRIEEQD